MEPSSSGNRGKRSLVATGDTPSKPVEKRRTRTSLFSSAKKPLHFSSPSSPARKTTVLMNNSGSPAKYHKWTETEDRALVEFISIAKTDHSYRWPPKSCEWPQFKAKHQLWGDAAKHIQEATASSFVLTNIRVRARTINKLKTKYGTIEEAEEKLGLSLAHCLEELDISVQASTQRHSRGVDKFTQTRELPREPANTTATCSQSALQQVQALVSQLSEEGQLSLANSMFLSLAVARGVDNNPGDFVSLSLAAMGYLLASQKPNLMYKFAYTLGTKKPGTNETLLPVNRMPFGLLQYQIEFFSCTNIMQINVPQDFAEWHETMCSEFPTRFNRLFRGPMWSSVSVEQQKDPLTARVNVAAPSLQWVEKRTSNSEFSKKPELQIAALEQLKVMHPKGRFWLKVDACDLKPALQESVRGEWNGDIDMEDEKLAKLKAEYVRRKKQASVPASVTRDILETRLTDIISDLELDVEFLSKGLKKADKDYQTKFNSPNSSREILKSLCWERVEYNTLLQQAQSLKSSLENVLPHLNPNQPRTADVIACLKNLKSDYLKYVKNVFVKKRQPAATHILVILLSEEKRSNKPYALPIQYIPYKSIKDQYIRDLGNKVKTAMVAMGLKPVGAVTDGEFSSLRTQGETRPLHIIQIIHDARESVSKQSQATLLSMLLKVGDDATGRPIVSRPNKYIPAAAITELHSLLNAHHMYLEDAVTYMRGKAVPAGHTPCSFRANVPESFLDKLRSLVGTYVYRGILDEYAASGVPFKYHLYCPERDPITVDYYHEREDHCHILKRIAKHTRDGGPPRFNLKGFDDAMLHPGTGLTHASLTGERKQSVQDAERLLSYHVAKFLREHGYDREAKYVEIVASWHEAADGRGLSELERCRKNYAMLSMILDDWMPWHTTSYDFSTIDINRPIKGICGFSRETVIAVTTNIESLEFRRCQSHTLGYEEHPRAGTTDDVEAFFALVHRFLGNIFTLKQFKYAWQKLVREFSKRMNPDLRFYYWTQNERYRDFGEDLPSFNVCPHDDDDDDPQDHPLRLRSLTINRREDASIFVPGRCFPPARNQTTIRQRIFRPNAPLPICQRDEI